MSDLESRRFALAYPIAVQNRPPCVFGKDKLMLSFTEHMKRIIQLAEQSLVHVQVDKFDAAQDDLFLMSHTARKAMKQISDMKSQKPNARES